MKYGLDKGYNDELSSSESSIEVTRANTLEKHTECLCDNYPINPY
jgi:hypothetical protein